MLRPAALTLTCALLAVIAPACGGAAAGGDDDPASLVPAGAALYVQAAIRPEGDRRTDALAAVGKLLRTDDPAARLRELFDEQLAQEGDGLTWERDFAPWVGEEGAVWAADLAADEPTGAVIVATRDAEAARAALEKFSRIGDRSVEERSHAGADYRVDADGEVFGMVGDFVVGGSEVAFKRAAELEDGGDNLAGSDRYEDAVDDLEDDRLGHYYLDLRSVVAAAKREDPETAAQLEQVESFVALDELGPATGSFQADGNGMALDTLLTGLPDGPLRDLARLSAGGETALLAGLPGDAWGAFATPELGRAAQKLFASVAGAIGGAAVAAQVRQATGLDLQEDLFAWIGDTGAFIRGTTTDAVSGALVIEATDEGRAEAAFGKLVGLLGREAGSAPAPVRLDGADAAFELAAPGETRPVVLARGNGRVVAASGREAASDALDPATELGDSELHGDAEELLGDDFSPALLLSVPRVIALADAGGATDADFDRARPYLEALGVLASGGTVEDDRVRSRLAVSLR